MEMEFCAIGGYSEIGMNMCAVKVGNEVVIFDMGFYLPEVIRLQDEETVKTNLTRDELINLRVIPNDHVINEWKPLVKAIVLCHCHLDHIGGIPYMADEFNCPIYGSAYTIEVLKSILKDEGIKLKNKLKVLNGNDDVKLTNNLTLEFMPMPHSTPMANLGILHTPLGLVIYGNDFKFDNSPIIGPKTDYKYLKELGEKGVILLVCDALYAHEEMKTPSELIAKEMLKDVMLSTENKDNLIIVTTFASHIARIKSTIEFAKKLNRKIIIMGRSMDRYITAAENIGLVNFRKDAFITKYADQIKKKLFEIQKNPSKYLIICTGHQGEPRSILQRLATKDLPYEFSPRDQVIFSCKVIPAPINIANRVALEAKLKQKGVRLFKDIHTSGHLAREDHHDLINLLKPKHIIPAQGDVTKLTPLADLAEEMGYVRNKTVHVLKDGEIISIE
ncbi:RNase J family beta-CASP ribonuclease [Candidatus Woesearchaeota archaeon]|nr:RNase J family beta-CASP ribonuclease [Candidatus Woesearchaeota archaeon]